MPTESGGTAPLVSVLMPVFNAAAVLERAVASVRAQSLPDWELLIVDDGSADESAAVIAGCAADDARIHTLAQGRNTGAAAARNRALAMARGRYIAFLDADDAWLPEKLDRQVGMMQRQDAALGFSGFWREENGSYARVRVPERVTRGRLLRGNVIGCLTAIYDRARLGDMPMPDLRLSHDYALWLDILGRIDHAAGLDEPLAIHHRSRGSLSASRLRSLQGTWGMYRSHLGLPRTRAAFYLAHHIARRARRGVVPSRTGAGQGTPG